MIFGIGTDIVQVARIGALLERYGKRFPERILAAAEFSEFPTSQWPAHFLARRFAAKEAAAKALGTGFRQGVQPRHIRVAHTPQGQPTLEWQGRTSELIQRFSIGQALLSLTDEKDYAVAFVILVATK